MSYIGKEPSYGVFEKQILTGDGSTLQFTLDHPVAGAGSILVSLGGVIQEPQSAYDINYISGSPKISFASAPAASTRIFIIYLARQQIVSARATTDTTPAVDNFTGDGSTTAFTLSRSTINPSTTIIDSLMVYFKNILQIILFLEQRLHLLLHQLTQQRL